MIPTITDSVNDNGAILSASKDAEQISVLYKKLANDNLDIKKSYEKTLSRIIDRHGSEGTQKLDIDNDNEQDAHLRPKPSPFFTQASNKTLDRIIDRHTPEVEGKRLLSWSNNNEKDFYDLSTREPNEDDHNKTMANIVEAQRAPIIHERTEADEKFATGVKKTEEDYLKSIDNSTTNILDVLKQMNSTLGDLEKASSVDSLRAREKGIESGHDTSHLDQDSILESLRGANKDNPDKGIAGESTKDKAIRVAKGAAVGLEVGAYGLVAQAAGKLLPEDDRQPGGGFDGKRQEPMSKAQNRKGEAPPVEQKPLAPPLPAVEPHNHIPNVKTPKGRRAQLELGVYSAFKKQGVTDEAAKTMVAEINRENSFREDIIFGSHRDPAKSKSTGQREWNLGMISWQLDRRKKLQDFLRKRGLLSKDGMNIQKSQASLDAMAEFMMGEIQKDKKMRPIGQAMMENGHSFDQLETMIGKGVIKWRHDDPKYSASGHRAQDQAYGEINKLLKDPAARGAALNQASTQNSAAAPNINVNVTNNNTTNHQNSAKQQTPQKPRTPPARSSYWDGWAEYFGLK
jgi:hypothetical protein